jgi:23S rRNA G2069 N7-methylase RlmK/C1962 C5-methylase RlmI
VACYRVYDADLPDYAFAVDLYRSSEATRLHVQEYAPPAGIDAAKAQLRRESVEAVLPELFGVDAASVVMKTRERKRGTAQYDRQDTAAEFHAVTEGGCTLLVNLRDYLDTGLFLDHRPLRMRIQRESRGKRFLNLYSYTGAATVHALRGGASSSVSVDLSNTYLNWALRNLELNGRESARSPADPRRLQEWLAHAATHTERYDLILLDPPSFSNSKATEGVLDIQRDHVELIRACVDLLAADGTLYFSTNLRSFKLNESALAGLECVNITAETIDEDFAAVRASIAAGGSAHRNNPWSGRSRRDEPDENRHSEGNPRRRTSRRGNARNRRTTRQTRLPRGHRTRCRHERRLHRRCLSPSGRRNPAECACAVADSDIVLKVRAPEPDVRLGVHVVANCCARARRSSASCCRRRTPS